jgi:hypothetical protein
MKREVEFEKSLIKTIDLQLKQVFGEAGTSVIYDYLQNALSLRQEEIPKKLEVFTEGLDRFLSSGARVIEKVILDGLYSDFGQEFEFKEGYTFVDYIDALRTTAKRDNK